MRISSTINSLNNLNSLFNTLHQGKISMYANKLSNSKFLFPENNAPGSGTISSDTVSYISDIKSASEDLSGALKALSGSAFNQRGMVSNNPEALSVSYTGNNINSMGDTRVKIDQIATGQRNEGASMRASATYTGDRGVNRFTIQTGGKTTELSVSVAAGDTNRDVQQKMATAINNSGAGLRATVETDAKTNTSTLRIEATNTGSEAKNAFTITDRTGNLAATTGANNRVSEGQDAIYRVNGGAAQTSRSNTINLGNGLSATLRSATDEEVTISRGRDSSRAISTVNEMVSSFNALFNAAAGNTSDPKAQGLASRLMNVSSVYSRSLSDIGIGFDSRGNMTIDSNRLNQAAESGRLERFFTENSGRNFGFTNQLGRIASNVTSNPSAFVSSSMFGGANFGYTGFGNASQMNASRAGSIFDFSF